MATATKRTIAPVAPAVEVTLVLNGPEARVLRDLLGAIGGTPDTRRGLTTRILDALEDVGFVFDAVHPTDHSGSIVFE